MIVKDITIPDDRIDRFILDLLTALDETQISMTEIRVYLVLSQSPQPLSLSEIARRINRDRKMARTIIDKMRESGFVANERDGISLTQEGEGEGERQRLNGLVADALGASVGTRKRSSGPRPAE
ncbi:MarR family transcriptional regulator [Paracoccus versutus]|uniref:MarR family transcriptional regulator n=1 Tax=Paracoccus versutus TaxID=34007 RepID=UPI000DF75DA6|nr:MarR family transcriptional regulator [Paracoccus versutus]RDD72732.1 hypothetical protein DVR11_04105 [Paracoccus versutus]